MKITDITVTPFRSWVDRYQNGEPLPRSENLQTLTTIETDEGISGYYLGGQGHGDQDGLDVVNRAYIEERIRPLLIGQNPFDREKFWHWMWAAKTPENIMGVVDMALWDLAGQVAGLPGFQAAGWLPGQGESLCQHLSQYGLGAELRRARHRVPRPGLSGVQDSSVLLLGPEYR